ncbi:NUDIX domain-containing protein [Paenibacillus sp. HB172176]|uniref:NUDIX domain-containing protein n=1 Tax=Paenibacillus sp. HB172176 TaxID=2493690 RepID=UPI0014398BF6|nr:NUDIX domain-containing protein [Paenibacillus sp. HB172176]
MKIRSSVCALIIRNNQILTIKKQEDEVIEYIMPGGGQEFGETLLEALHREVREEVGASIMNAKLIFVREYIGKNHENADRDKGLHIVNHIFSCEIEEENKYELEPDPDQIGIEWINIDELEKYKFYPKDLIEELKKIDGSKGNETYIGDIN